MFLAPTDPYEISRLIDSLKRQKYLKDIKHEICLPLTILVNKALGAGIVPDLLKTAKVIPIYKAKDKEQLNNYRPISLLPTICKILETFSINDFAISYSPNQFSTKAKTGLDQCTGLFMLYMNL